MGHVRSALEYLKAAAGSAGVGGAGGRFDRARFDLGSRVEQEALRVFVAPALLQKQIEPFAAGGSCTFRFAAKLGKRAAGVKEEGSA